MTGRLCKDRIVHVKKGCATRFTFYAPNFEQVGDILVFRLVRVCECVWGGGGERSLTI